MKNKHIRTLNKLSLTIHNFIHEYDYVLGKRNKKTSILDGVVYKIIQGEKEMSGPKATYAMNKFKNMKISRTSYGDREKQISLDLYKQIYGKISNGLNFINDGKICKQILAVDATQFNLNKKIANDGLKLNKNQLSINGFALGVYNVTYGTPISLKLLNHKNERKGFLDYLNDTEEDNSYIYVLDRGYYSEDLVEKLFTKNVNFVCRLRDNLKIIPKNMTDEIVKCGNTNLRVITYTINKMKYYLGTNLNKDEFSEDGIKNMYHQRWSIEEFFKYLKQNMDLNRLNEKTFDEIQRSLYSYLIIRKLVDAICKIKGLHKNNKMIINKAVLTKAIYEDFIFRFFYNQKIGDKSIRKFIDTAVQYEITHRNESNPRTSSIPYTKWYVKKFYHKYVLEGKKKYHSTMELKKLGVSNNLKPNS